MTGGWWALGGGAGHRGGRCHRRCCTGAVVGIAVAGRWWASLSDDTGGIVTGGWWALSFLGDGGGWALRGASSSSLGDGGWASLSSANTGDGDGRINTGGMVTRGWWALLMLDDGGAGVGVGTVIG